MIDFDTWNAELPAEIALVVLENIHAKTDITRPPVNGEEETKQLPGGSEKSATSCAGEGSQCLVIARNHIDKGMLSIGKMMAIIRKEKDLSTSEALLKIKKELLDIPQQAEHHPMQMLNNAIKNIDNVLAKFGNITRNGSHVKSDGF
jgi:hypothetical protein